MGFIFCFFFQAEDGIRDGRVTGVQTCALPISGAVVVQGKNIQGRTCDWTDRRYVSHEKYETLRRSHCSLGDLIFPKVGTIGKVGRLTRCPGVNEYVLSTN